MTQKEASEAIASVIRKSGDLDMMGPTLAFASASCAVERKLSYFQFLAICDIAWQLAKEKTDVR